VQIAVHNNTDSQLLSRKVGTGFRIEIMLKEVAMDAAAAQAFDLARLNRAFLDDPYPTYRGSDHWTVIWLAAAAPCRQHPRASAYSPAPTR
jgi:hypothetical protein